MRLCSGAGCGRKVADDVRYCDECRTERTDNAEPVRDGWHRAQDDPLLLEYKGERWNKGVRPRVLAKYPMCVDCKTALSQIADHNIPARVLIAECRRRKLFPLERYPGFYIFSNLRGRCHKCHNAKSRVEDAQDWSAEIEVLLAPFKGCNKIAL